MSNAFLYTLTVFVWGSTWLAIEFQLGTVAPDVSVFYRYALAAALLFAFCVVRGSTLRFRAGAHLRFMLLGLLLFSLNYILTYRAQVHITSAMAAIAFSTMVWMNMLNARIAFGIRTEARALLGSLLGIAGLVVIFYPQLGSGAWSNSTLYGSLLALLGALVASWGNMVSVEAQQKKLPVVASNAWAMAYGALFTGLFAWQSGAEFVFERSFAYIASLVYLAVFGSIIAFGAYLTLLGRIGAHRAGYAMVLFPVVALVLSVLFEGLAITPGLLAGVLLVLSGNALVLRSKRAAVPAAGCPDVKTSNVPPVATKPPTAAP